MNQPAQALMLDSACSEHVSPFMFCQVVIGNGCIYALGDNATRLLWCLPCISINHCQACQGKCRAILKHCGQRQAASGLT